MSAMPDCKANRRQTTTRSAVEQSQGAIEREREAEKQQKSLSGCLFEASLELIQFEWLSQKRGARRGARRSIQFEARLK